MIKGFSKSTYVFIFILLVLIVIYQAIFSTSSQGDKQVIGHFARALYSGDYDKVESMIPQEMEGSINKWKETHGEINCPLSQRLSSNGTQTYYFLDYVTEHIKIYDYHFVCRQPNNTYIFEIQNIMVTNENGDWEIVSWSKICGRLSDSDPYTC